MSQKNLIYRMLHLARMAARRRKRRLRSHAIALKTRYRFEETGHRRALGKHPLTVTLKETAGIDRSIANDKGPRS